MHSQIRSRVQNPRFHRTCIRPKAVGTASLVDHWILNPCMSCMMMLLCHESRLPQSCARPAISAGQNVCSGSLADNQAVLHSSKTFG